MDKTDSRQELNYFEDLKNSPGWLVFVKYVKEKKEQIEKRILKGEVLSYDNYKYYVGCIEGMNMIDVIGRMLRNKAEREAKHEGEQVRRNI